MKFTFSGLGAFHQQFPPALEQRQQGHSILSIHSLFSVLYELLPLQLWIVRVQ